MIAPVRLFRRCEAGILAHRPQARAIHCGLHAPRERKFARIAGLRVAIEVTHIFFAEKIRYDDFRAGDKCVLPLFRFLSGLARGRLTPLLRVSAHVWFHKASPLSMRLCIITCQMSRLPVPTELKITCYSERSEESNSPTEILRCAQNNRWNGSGSVK